MAMALGGIVVGHWRNRLGGFCKTEAEADADNATKQAQHDRFHEKLQQHVLAAGADRHPQADLACPLGDRDEHDVHDADAADEQRNAGNRRQQRGHRAWPFPSARPAISSSVRTMKSSGSPRHDLVRTRSTSSIASATASTSA